MKWAKIGTDLACGDLGGARRDAARFQLEARSSDALGASLGLGACGNVGQTCAMASELGCLPAARGVVQRKRWWTIVARTLPTATALILVAGGGGASVHESNRAA